MTPDELAETIARAKAQALMAHADDLEVEGFMPFARWARKAAGEVEIDTDHIQP